MAEIVYEVKCSKKVILLAIFLCIFAEIVFGGCSIMFFIRSFSSVNISRDSYIGNIVGLCIMFLFFTIIFLGVIYAIRKYKKQIDVYTEDKMYRKMGDKILFEIEYKNIKAIRESLFHSFFIFCKEGFIKNGWNKGAKTFSEYYTKQDIHYIRQIISDKYFNIEFS